MGILKDCIMGNLNGMFDQINTEVGAAAAEVGKTPAAWNAGVFSMIRGLSDNVVVPIAGIVLTFVLCYELINMIIERNNFHDFETFTIYKWIFKTYVAVYLVSHTFDITMAIFDVAQKMVQQSAGIITGSTSIMHRDRMGMVILSSMDSTSRPNSSPMPIASSWADISPKAAAKSMLVLPVMIPALCCTNFWATSKIAMVMSKVWDTR